MGLFKKIFGVYQDNNKEVETKYHGVDQPKQTTTTTKQTTQTTNYHGVNAPEQKPAQTTKAEATRLEETAPVMKAPVAEKSENATVKFVFNELPKSLDDLKSLPEASMDTPFKSAALAMYSLLTFEFNRDLCFECLTFLAGPAGLSPREKAFYTDRLAGKEYKPRSFFVGATRENNYVPNLPYTLYVMESPYSYEEENYALLYVQSSGADAPRGIKLRKKPSTGQWFVIDIQTLADIRIPVEKDD